MHTAHVRIFPVVLKKPLYYSWFVWVHVGQFPAFPALNAGVLLRKPNQFSCKMSHILDLVGCSLMGSFNLSPLLPVTWNLDLKSCSDLTKMLNKILTKILNTEVRILQCSVLCFVFQHTRMLKISGCPITNDAKIWWVLVMRARSLMEELRFPLSTSKYPLSWHLTLCPPSVFHPKVFSSID